MMIYWNEKESIFFGFSAYQSYYPISGGWLQNNNCPHGYSAFIEQRGDIRYYGLSLCNACN